MSRWEEGPGVQRWVQHLHLDGDNSDILRADTDPAWTRMKDVEETNATYEWCVVACGEYSEAGRRWRAGPYVLNKRSLSLRQDLVEVTPAGGVRVHALVGHCEREDPTMSKLGPIVD